VDADLDGPLPWLATAYVAGPSLAAAVAAHGPLPPASVVMLAAGLAESLTSIHSGGVVHRDLKPSNVLLADDGPRVIDFGIFQAAAASGLTQAGSPASMSPEQAEGGQLGPPSDVFSFGAVLTFAASGHLPFGDDSASALQHRIVPGIPFLDDVSAEIRALVERCLSKEPSQRPTAPELLADTDVSAAWLPEPVIGEVPRQAGHGFRPPGIEAVSPMAYGQQPAPNATASRPADGRQHGGHLSSRWCQAPPVLVAMLADRNSSAVYAVAFSPAVMCWPPRMATGGSTCGMWQAGTLRPASPIRPARA
jgi:serine/threonine protein kinase